MIARPAAGDAHSSEEGPAQNLYRLHSAMGIFSASRGMYGSSFQDQAFGHGDTAFLTFVQGRLSVPSHL